MRSLLIASVIVLIISGCNTKKPPNKVEPVTTNDTTVVASPDTSNNKGVNNSNTDMTQQDYGGVGELTIGLSHSKVIELLGEPASKSKKEEWGADGLMHQDWLYTNKGIVLNMSSEKSQSRQEIFSITISSPCAYKTKKNVGIGSSYKDVMAAYEKDIDKSNSNTTTITVGSIYGGIIFTFGKDDKADTIFIGAAAE